MLLRRVIEHVKAQNWTAVALDFVIVVVGVFIGIQMANWNEARAEKKLATALASQLLADLKQDRVLAQLVLDYFSAVSDAAHVTIDQLDDPDTDPEAFAVNAYNATEFMITPQHRSTYDELLATGSLGLVGDANFRNLLVLYYRQDSMQTLGQYVRDSAYRETLRRTMPHSVQEAVRSACGDIYGDSGYIIGLKVDCELGMPEDDLRAAVEAIRTRPSMAEDLRFYLSTLDAHIDGVSGMKHRLDVLIETGEALH